MDEMDLEVVLAIVACFEPPNNEQPHNEGVQEAVEQSGVTADVALDVFITCPPPLRAPPRLGARRHLRSALLYVSWT
ncbi:hypothetical protein N7540_005012 [Penicillium herquei]|nr:hypothetical protein N7540_005012 [Penicillium herquei]